jgi:hypothetical protein
MLVMLAGLYFVLLAYFSTWLEHNPSTPPFNG